MRVQFDPPGEGETYTPKYGEVAGLDLFGERQDDGSIKLGSKSNILPSDDRTHLPAFPEEVTVEGMTFQLEFVKENEWDGRADVEKADPTDHRLKICWGVYV